MTALFHQITGWTFPTTPSTQVWNSLNTNMLKEAPTPPLCATLFSSLAQFSVFKYATEASPASSSSSSVIRPSKNHSHNLQNHQKLSHTSSFCDVVLLLQCNAHSSPTARKSELPEVAPSKTNHRYGEGRFAVLSQNDGFHRMSSRGLDIRIEEGNHVVSFLLSPHADLTHHDASSRKKCSRSMTWEWASSFVSIIGTPLSN